MAKLAICGGSKLRTEPFPKHPIITEEDKKRVMNVLEEGNISSFGASAGKKFYGGKQVKELEKVVSNYFSTKYAVALNSWTAGLHASIVACGINPGDEIIVPPYTFTSTATACLMHNVIPVFADVDIDTFCISPKSIEEKITDRTKAIIPVHLFGNSADMDKILEISQKYNLKLIEDAAQAIGGKYKNKFLCTIGDCGGISLQESKTVMCGEGGVLITNNEQIARVAQMVRNHGEVIIENEERTYTPNLIGYNYRMTELEAALASSQFSRLDEYNSVRRELAEYLIKKLSGFDFLIPQQVTEGCEHSFYLVAFRFLEDKINISRDLFVKAVDAEGIPVKAGYVKPLYYSPIYHDKKPFIYKYFGQSISYEKGICPVTERLYEKELITFQQIRPPAKIKDIDDIVSTIEKIVANKEELKEKNIILEGSH